MGRNKGGNLTMAQILAGSMLLTNNLGLGHRQNHLDLMNIDPPRFVKSKNYYKKDDGHGGEPAKARRLKQMLKMPPHEIVKQHHASL